MPPEQKADSRVPDPIVPTVMRDGQLPITVASCKTRGWEKPLVKSSSATQLSSLMGNIQQTSRAEYCPITIPSQETECSKSEGFLRG